MVYALHILRCEEELLATTWLAGVGLALSWVLGTVPWEVHVPTYLPPYILGYNFSDGSFKLLTTVTLYRRYLKI